ncbi:MAG TPA: hypothetical protein VLF93_02815 [Candidatus Saccharimonadales bacterium]|nr:hypothetical protein [Candidatus Saccharimonadales bacterium]
MNKRYLIIIGVIIIFVIFIGVIFFQQTPKQSPSSTTPSQTVITGSLKKPTANKFINPTMAPPANTPKLAAQQFYIYFFSQPSNPLANGAFKTNPYLSDDFKQIIAEAYRNGNTPVFCPANETQNVVVGKEQSIYYNNGYLMQEIVSQAPPGNKDLYTMRMQNVNGKWLVFDINCIPQ